MSGADNERQRSAMSILLSSVMPTSKEGLDEIAQKLGYEKANILVMFARGDAKVPIDKVPTLASVLGIDRGKLLRLALEQGFPKSSSIGLLPEFIISENEMVLIKTLRAACGDTDPVFNRDQIQVAVDALSRVILSHGETQQD